MNRTCAIVSTWLVSALLLVGADARFATAEPLVKGRTIAKNATPYPIEAGARGKEVHEVLGITYPFALTLKSTPGCAGELVDSLGQRICFVLDNRPMHTEKGDSTLPERLISLGCPGSNPPSVRALESGGREEAALIDAFELYTDTFVRPAQRDSLLTTPYYYWYRLSDEQNKARIVLGTANFLRDQAAKRAAADSTGP